MSPCHRDVTGWHRCQSSRLIFMTAQHQHCVDLLTDLQAIGIDGSISKPFPTAGRTLAVVIEDVLAKHRRFRVAANGQPESLTPFPGGVLAYHPQHIELCGETIAEKSRSSNKPAAQYVTELFSG